MGGNAALRADRAILRKDNRRTAMARLRGSLRRFRQGGGKTGSSGEKLAPVTERIIFKRSRATSWKKNSRRLLDPEVKDFEPALALDGGADGLDPYPHLMAEAKRLLTPHGTAVFEIGYDQGEAVLALATDVGCEASIKQDLAGRDRAVIFTFHA